MVLNIRKGPKKIFAQFLRRIEVAIMSGVQSNIVPESFDGVQFGRIGGKEKDLNALSVFLKPVVDFRLLVIGSIILDQIDPVAALIKRGHQSLLQILDVGGGVEVVGLVAINKVSIIQGNPAQDFLSIALSSGGNLRLGIQGRPSLVKRRTLSEENLIGVDNQGLFLLSFFFKFG